MRPVYHQLAERTRGYLFTEVLAYHLLVSIDHQLREAGDHRSWSTIKERLSTHQRSTVIVRDKDGQIHHIRVSGTPETSHNDIYKKNRGKRSAEKRVQNSREKVVVTKLKTEIPS